MSSSNRMITICSILICLVFVLHIPVITGCVPPSNKGYPTQSEEQFLSDLKARTFNYFWDIMDTSTFQTDDRFPDKHFTSIAATGFALTSYIIGIDNSYINRQEGAIRVQQVLRWLWHSTQGSEIKNTSGYKGFYYHFLNYGTGYRYEDCELSTIDSGLLMAGILSCQSYFDQDNELESEIRILADSLYLSVDWSWAMNNKPFMSMGWKPETGFLESEWQGYNEAMILLILGLGSPTHPIPSESWQHWCSTYVWDTFYGYEHIAFGPLFGHQYSHLFIDFRGIRDPYMTEKGIDYFENSRRATLANRAYCIDNPKGFIGYGPNLWGLSACDGPANLTRFLNNNQVQFHTYFARGAAVDYIEDDGTITPTAAGGSIAFTPKESIQTLMYMKDSFGSKMYQEYGFKDAVNLSYQEGGWFNPDYIGIDQGAILIMLENYQSELIWSVMKKNPYIINGLRKAGFGGGWLADK